MAELRDTLILDIDRALRQVAELENALNRALGQLTIDVDVGPLDDDLREVATSADRVSDEFREVEQAADRAADETARIDDEARRAAGSVSTLGSTLKRLAISAAVAIGLREVVQFAKGAVDEAVNLSESINAVEVVFGDASETILQFGADTSDAVFLAASEFNQLASVTGTLLQGFGLDVEQVADITIVLTKRAADLASVFNTEVSVALEAINAALRGETEQIRRFTGSFSIDEVKAFGRELFNVEGALTTQQTALAAVEFLLRKTDAVQGDAANTANELANRQRALNEVWKNAQAAIGEGLVPALESLIPLLIEAAEATGRAGPAFIQNVKDTGSAVADFLGIFGNLAQAVVALPFDDIGLEGFRTQFEDAADSSARLVATVKGADSVLRDFIPLLSDGEDNAADFANALFTLAASNDLTAERFDQFAVAAAAGGVGIQDQAAALRAIIQSGQVAGPQLAILVDEFLGLLSVLRELDQIGGITAVIPPDELARLGAVFGTFGGDIQGILGDIIQDQLDTEESALALAIALDTEADAFRESAFVGAAFAKAQQGLEGNIDAVTRSIDEQRQAILDLVREQQAASDPIINLIRRDEDLIQAQADLAEIEAAGAERADELGEAQLRVIEATNDLEFAEIAVVIALDETTEAFINQALAAGLAETAIDGFLRITDRLSTTPTFQRFPDFDLRDTRTGGSGGGQVPQAVVTINNPVDPDIPGNAAQAANMIGAIVGATSSFVGRS